MDAVGNPSATSSVPESEDDLSAGPGESRADGSHGRRAVARAPSMRRSLCRQRRLSPPPMRTTVLSRFGATEPVISLEKIAVPAGGHTVALPFPPPKEEKKPEEPPPPPGGDEAAPADAAKAAPPPLPPLKTPLEHGLVAVISDHQTHLTTVRWLDIAPQRPRRYVHPQVAYDFDAGRLRIRVQPQDKSLLPPGTVHVHAELVPAARCRNANPLGRRSGRARLRGESVRRHRARFGQDADRSDLGRRLSACVCLSGADWASNRPTCPNRSTCEKFAFSCRCRERPTKRRSTAFRSTSKSIRRWERSTIRTTSLEVGHRRESPARSARR